jgi:Ca2+-binding RTX toxin-like protein
MANYYGNDADNIEDGVFVNFYGGDGNDVLLGTNVPNQIYGGQGNDLLGGSVNQAADGFGTLDEPFFPTDFLPSGNDYLEGGSGLDGLFGADGDDIIYGGDGSDSGTVQGLIGAYIVAGLYGGEGDDTIFGGRDNDNLFGGPGKDLLYGGPDKDWFYFDSALNKKTNVDQIRDFSLSDNDKIVLSKAIFTDIGSTLKKNEFHIGKNATTKKQRILYDDDKGKLFFDHDGRGGDAKILFARLEKGLDLGAGDFVMIA